MQILITQRSLAHRGGSELVTVEAALGLKERGHEVTVFATTQGELATKLRSLGVAVVADLKELTWEPDIIHGQHHLQTMAALARFPATPVIYFCHGFLPWVEHPPKHRRIVTYILPCSAMAAGMEPFYGVPPSKVQVVGNWVDTRRFTTVRTPKPTPQRALLYGNNYFTPEEVKEMETACAEAGIALDRVGGYAAKVSKSPESLLPDYDLVFAVGRSALEAMASGCAVIPVMPSLAGPLITVSNFQELAAVNFAGRVSSPSSLVRKEWLLRQFSAYDPDEVAAVTRLSRESHSQEQAINKLVAIYEGAIAARSATPDGPEFAFDPELADYLLKIIPEVDRLWNEDWQKQARQDEASRKEAEIQELKAQQLSLTQKLAEVREKLALNAQKSQTARHAWKCTQAVLKQSVWGRVWFRKIRRLTESIEP